VRDAVLQLMKRPLESLIVAIGFNESVQRFRGMSRDDIFPDLARPHRRLCFRAGNVALVLLFCDITPKPSRSDSLEASQQSPRGRSPL